MSTHLTITLLETENDSLMSISDNNMFRFNILFYNTITKLCLFTSSNTGSGKCDCPFSLIVKVEKCISFTLFQNNDDATRRILLRTLAFCKISVTKKGCHKNMGNLLSLVPSLPFYFYDFCYL